MRLVVDGETFEILQRPGEPDTYDFDWVSGPNPGYGFSSFGGIAAVRVGEPRPEPPPLQERLEQAIRTFLAQVDPETGYIEG